MSLSLMLLAAALICAFMAMTLGFLPLIRALDERAQQARSAFIGADEPSIADVASNIPPESLTVPTALAVIGLPILLYWASGNLMIALGMGVLLSMLPGMILRSITRKRRKLFVEQMPDTFQMLSSSLQAGLSLNQAIETVVREAPQPTAYEFALVHRKLRLGGDFDTATDLLLKRMPNDVLTVAISAMRVSRRIGGNLIVLMDDLSAQMRTKAEMEGKIASLTAQGRVQGKVMSFLPVLLMIAMYFLDPVSMTHMFTTPVGWGALAIIGILLVLGFISIRSIVAIDV